MKTERPAYSAIVVTGGRRPAALRALTRRLLAQGQAWEVIIAGDWEAGAPRGLKVLPYPAEARAGAIGFLRNQGAEAARGGVLVFLDDDMELTPAWEAHAPGLLGELGAGRAELGTCRVLGPNGRRWYDWSWASRSCPDAPPMLLPYGVRDRNGYLSGCCILARRDAWGAVRFREDLGYYEREDVDFSHRAQEAGQRIRVDPRAAVRHLLLPGGRRAGETDPLPQIQFLYRSGRLEEARRLLEARGEGLAPFVRGYTRGLFALFAGEAALARAALEGALGGGADAAGAGARAQCHYRLGQAWLKLGCRREARGAFEAALALVPDHPFARFRLERLERGPGRKEPAVA